MTPEELNKSREVVARAGELQELIDEAEHRVECIVGGGKEGKSIVLQLSCGTTLWLGADDELLDCVKNALKNRLHRLRYELAELTL